MNRRRSLPPLLVAALLLVTAACADTSKYDPLPVPEGAPDVPATSSTIPGGLGRVALPAVPGTTTTAPAAIGPGPVTIVGRVDGPDGPVGNARVRLERVTDAGVAVVEVPTAADGTWNAANVLGGRYRIRAWQQPALGMLRAQVVFIESPGKRPVVLRLDRFEGTRIDAVVAPSPVVGQPANLKVRVATRQVDERGFVRFVPSFGVTATLTGPGAWNVRSPNPQFTDAEGAAVWELECLQSGPQPLSVVLDSGESDSLDLPPCAPAGDPGDDAGGDGGEDVDDVPDEDTTDGTTEG